MKSKYDTKEILRNGTDPLNIPNGTYPVGKTQDTPEELIKRKLKEITTSERVGFLYAVGDDDLLANELYDYIQQLLDEREREVEKNLFKRLYSARSKKEFREMLDKLKGKK